MTKRLAVLLGVSVVLGVSAIIGLPSAALADKTVTFLTAGSAVTSMSFDLSMMPAQINADVCGKAPLQSGGFGQPSCYHISLTAGAVFTAVSNLATGAALTFWKTQEGL